MTEEAPARSYFAQPAQPAAAAETPLVSAKAGEPVEPPAQPVVEAAPIEAVPAQPEPAPAQPTVYVLAIAELSAIAEQAGLQWVQSDAGKVAQVQAAIAAEPQPVRVPREPRPVVLVDEGPLILVETRRDLAEMKLPFEA